MIVYLDHNATTPIDPRVRHACEPWLGNRFGNASSRDHAFGWDAAEAVEEARAAVADVTGATPAATTFTSGATEALNTVIRGYVGYRDWGTKAIVTCGTEHDAVLAACRKLNEWTGVRLTILPVDSAGHLDLVRLTHTLAASPGALVALMMANNEIGTIHPIAEIARIVHACDGALLCDTTQAVGRLAVNISLDEIDFATISAHKIHGPKGAGALVAATRAIGSIDPLIVGGAQERGLRGGTLDVAGIVGLGAASRLVQDELDGDMSRMAALRDRLEAGVSAQLSDTWVNGDREQRLCNTTNIGFLDIDARLLIRDMNEIAVSTRAACSSGANGPSHVLTAIGLTDRDAYSCVRFSLGRFTTAEDVDHAVESVVRSVFALRRRKSARA